MFCYYSTSLLLFLSCLFLSLNNGLITQTIIFTWHDNTCNLKMFRAIKCGHVCVMHPENILEKVHASKQGPPCPGWAHSPSSNICLIPPSLNSTSDRVPLLLLSAPTIPVFNHRKNSGKMCHSNCVTVAFHHYDPTQSILHSIVFIFEGGKKLTSKRLKRCIHFVCSPLRIQFPVLTWS